MAKFRDVKTLQKFAAVHASIHNHFNQDRHLNRRDIFRTEPFRRPGRVAAAGGLSASDRHPSQAGSGLSDSASAGSVWITLLSIMSAISNGFSVVISPIITNGARTDL